MAQQDEDTPSTTSSASSSFDDDEDDTDHELEQQQQLEQLFQRAAAPVPQQHGDNDRVLVQTMLESLGFEKKHVDRGIRLYEKNYGTGSYNPDDITQIILQLQEKEEIKKQKRQLLAMNLDPKLAAEIFGDQAHKFGMKPKSASKSKSKTSGYHRGDIIMYREKRKAQIMDKLDEYLLICWPLTKPMYQRAILWANVQDIKQRSDKPKKQKKGQKEKFGGGVFGGMFGGGSSSRSKHKSDAKEAKYSYKFEKLWRHLIVDAATGKKDEEKEANNNDARCEMIDVKRNNNNALKPQFMEESGDKYRVCGMYQIHNESVTRLYNKRKDLIVRFALDSDENKTNELKLWYVVSRRDVSKMVNDGFKRKYGRMNAFGFGHKFYRNAYDALVSYGEYYNKIGGDSDDVHYLLYCSVICGESCLGHKDMKIPKHKAAKSYILYETAVYNEDLNANKCFITFQDHQAMAHYVLCVKPKQAKKQKKSSNSQYDFNSNTAKVFMQHFNPNPSQKNVNVSAPFPPQQVIKPDQHLPNIPNYPHYIPPQGYQQYVPNANQPPIPQQFGPRQHPHPHQHQQQPQQPQPHAQHHMMHSRHHHHQRQHAAHNRPHPPQHSRLRHHQRQHAHSRRHQPQPQQPPPQPQLQQQQQQQQQQPQPHQQFHFVPFNPVNPNNNNNNNNNNSNQPQQPQPQQEEEQVEDQNLFDSV